MKVVRTLIPLPEYLELDKSGQRDIKRVEHAVKKVHALAPNRNCVTTSWVQDAAVGLTHPLSHHAIKLSGKPSYRDNTTLAEQRVIKRHGVSVLNALKSGHPKFFLDEIAAAVASMGATSAKSRSGGVMLCPDGAGLIVEFPCSTLINKRVLELSDFLKVSTAPASFKAIVIQAAFLNLHPLTDGNGRASRLLFNALLWSSSRAGELYLPLYELRLHAPFSFEISLRSAEIHGSWLMLARFYADFVESYLRALNAEN